MRRGNCHIGWHLYLGTKSWPQISGEDAFRLFKMRITVTVLRVMGIPALFRDAALTRDSLKRAGSFGTKTSLQMFWCRKEFNTDSNKVKKEPCTKSNV